MVRSGRPDGCGTLPVPHLPASSCRRCRRRRAVLTGAPPSPPAAPSLPQFKIEPFKHPLKLDPNYAGAQAQCSGGTSGRRRMDANLSSCPLLPSLRLPARLASMDAAR